MNKIIILLLFLFPSAVLAYSSPGSPQGHVNDFANVLSAKAKADLEELLSAYEQKNGHQIAVAVVANMAGETVETYAEKLFQEWGIGQKNQDNGALFLASIAEREMRIETGYGLEGDLTDIEAKQIVATVVPPYFRNNDYDAGVRAAVVGMIQAIGGDINVLPAKKSGASKFPWGNYFWIAIGLFMWLTSILARSRSWWLGGIVGAVIGIIIWIIAAMWFLTPVFIVFGLLFDYLVSKKYKQAAATGNFHGLWWMGGGSHGWDKGGGWGGFGGFGGGHSGGGGASGRW